MTPNFAVTIVVLILAILAFLLVVHFGAPFLL